MRAHVTSEPLQFAYADPPYPGKSSYYKGHRDYAGEVDHVELVASLCRYDGWALSTSATALPAILAMCPPGVRVASWCRGSRNGKSAWPRSAWEPVIYAGGRRIVGDAGDDAHVHVARPRTTDPERVIGAKPAKFAFWLFRLLGAQPGDELHDLFPGSGGIARAWAIFAGDAPQMKNSCPVAGEASSVDRRRLAA